MKVPMPSSVSSRMFRRRRGEDTADNKDSRRRRFGKKNLRSSIPASSPTRSISKFSTTSSSQHEDLPFPKHVSAASLTDTSTSTCCDSTFEGSVNSDDRCTISSTVIVEEPVEHAVRADEEKEKDDSDSFFSRLLDLIQCFPNNQQMVAEKSIEMDAVENVMEESIGKIECVCYETIVEEEEFQVQDDLSLEDNQHVPISDRVPLPPVSEWRQDPLLLVASPGSEMLIRRIRRASEPSYFESSDESDCFDNNQAMQLPINNGKEEPMHSWVIDFETPVFAGTALFRIRGSNDWEKSKNNKGASCDYFAKHNRKFQQVIRGRFKTSIIMADCTSGLLLDRPLNTSRPPEVDCVDGLPCAPIDNSMVSKSKSKSIQVFKKSKSSNNDSLPPKWALHAAEKVASVLSPRMDADLECDHPRILSPLCSTAQTISVARKVCQEHDAADGDYSVTELYNKHEEPCPRSEASIVHDLSNASVKKVNSSSTNYAQQRKRACNAVFDARVGSLAKGSVESNKQSAVCFDEESEYTFEFLQHLVDYNDLSLDIGSVFGKVRLGGGLRGQPVRLLAAAAKDRLGDSLDLNDFDALWAFDLWHTKLLPRR